MSDDLVRLEGPPQLGWRVSYGVLAICNLALAWALVSADWLPLWLALIPAAAGAGLIACAVLLDETEAWVRSDAVTVRRRNLLRNTQSTVQVSEIKAIRVQPDWLIQLLSQRFIFVPQTWRVAIDTANHSRLTGGQDTVENNVWALEQRVRRIVGW